MKPIVIAALALSSLAFASAREACEYPGKQPPGLKTQEGYLDFIPPDQLEPFKRALPTVSNLEVHKIMRSPHTMWYDEASMVFLYQDSIEVVTGGRANCVGRKVGENNASDPAISKLMNYFGPDYRFYFPFRKAAGTDNVENVHVLNFWSPPRRDGKPLPVKWWQQSSRGRWSWVFPVGTMFGEVLYQKAPDQTWVVFEIRTRKRYLDGWEVNVFRPFNSAEKLALEIIHKRPNWGSIPNLREVVTHLRNKQTLVKNTWESKAFGKVFPPIHGALDLIPEITDPVLVTELLTETPFTSAEGTIWKENGTLQTYAPGSTGNFSIVPKGYEMGMIPVNEVSCNRCHSEVGRRLGDLEFDVILYGEVWGEDRIFTWHLFEPHERIYGTWDDADGSRKLNPRMALANLLKSEKPKASDPDYKPLPSVFVPDRLWKKRFSQRSFASSYAR